MDNARFLAILFMLIAVYLRIAAIYMLQRENEFTMDVYAIGSIVAFAIAISLSVFAVVWSIGHE